MITAVHYLIDFLVAFAVTAIATPFVRKFAKRFDIVDHPGPRRVNTVPIPRMGGIAMFLGLLVAAAFDAVLGVQGVWHSPLAAPGYINEQMVGVFIGLAVIVAVGVIDDVVTLKPLPKILGQIAAASIIAGSGVLIMRFHMPFSPEIVSFGVWAYPLTVLYLVCFVNIINLIDGLDGLAAGITAIASISLFVLVLTLYRTDAAVLAIVLAGACIGFLIYNFYPASIFMGDSGSMMLGLALGTVSLLGAARFSSVTIMLVPIVIALVPIIDTFGAIVRRLRGHVHVYDADAGHIHHRLLRAGFSQRKAVLFIYAWTAILSVGALMIWELGSVTKYVVFIVLIVASAFVVKKLGLFGIVSRTFAKGDDPAGGDSTEEGKAADSGDTSAIAQENESPGNAEH